MDDDRARRRVRDPARRPAAVRADAAAAGPEDVADVIAYCVAAPLNVTIAHVALAPTWLP